MKTGDIIKAKRIEKKLSQGQLAKLLGVTQRIISYWESNKNEPGDKHIPKISDILNIPLKDLTKNPGLLPTPKSDKVVFIELIDLLHETGQISSEHIDDCYKEVIILAIKNYIKEKEGRI